ncbi:MAG: multidrug efflux pump subunit AcrA (membrane-fusion protein) [Alteromonadaceae bacterium]|jgi:multidrug efflux pump subunit AcrA (membrane-fusion protein)
MKIIILLLFLLLLSCQSEQSHPLLFKVERQGFTVDIPSKGELFAAKATIISAPIFSNGSQNIAWLAPEFSMVKAGDIIARFDGEAMQFQSINKENELAITEQDIIDKKGMLNKELDAINQDIAMVGKEKVFAENFSIDDVRIRSKLEIIDSLQNTAYLGSKQKYLHWKSGSFSESSTGDMGLLEMQQQQHQSKLKQLSSSLNQLEVKAPHDGLLVYKANWRGEKPRAGQSLWPGQKIAELPNINEMKAKLFVIESEAIALAEGKKVSLYLFAHVDKPFLGIIESVASFPKSIKRGDPQKYVEVIVKLAKQNIDLYVPGRKLQATIAIAKKPNKLIVPLQSVFNKKNQSYVYLYDGNKFKVANVTLGQASLSHVEIVSGLKSGQYISLTDQEQS